MEYKLVKASPIGLPYNRTVGIKNGKDLEYGIDVVITTGIVNQVYSGFQNVDRGFCKIEKTDNVEKIESKIQLYADAFVRDKYPTT